MKALLIASIVVLAGCAGGGALPSVSGMNAVHRINPNECVVHKFNLPKNGPDADHPTQMVKK